jgi:hypothetical protein
MSMFKAWLQCQYCILSHYTLADSHRSRACLRVLRMAGALVYFGFGSPHYLQLGEGPRGNKVRTDWSAVGRPREEWTRPPVHRSTTEGFLSRNKAKRWQLRTSSKEPSLLADLYVNRLWRGCVSICISCASMSCCSFPSSRSIDCGGAVWTGNGVQMGADRKASRVYRATHLRWRDPAAQQRSAARRGRKKQSRGERRHTRLFTLRHQSQLHPMRPKRHHVLGTFIRQPTCFSTTVSHATSLY